MTDEKWTIENPPQAIFTTKLKHVSIFFLNAGEVDPYLAWKISLKDASILINQYFNREITKTLNQLPDNFSCETASAEILKNFDVVLNSPLEK